MQIINEVITMYCELDISDKITLGGIIISLFVSVISIIISVKTLKQNNKMIEENTRPVISMYSRYYNDMLYIVLKNFGNSPCTIDFVESNMNITKEEDQGFIGCPLENTIGAVIPPQHNIVLTLISCRLEQESYHFKIKYSSSTKSYCEEFTVNWKADNAAPIYRQCAETEKKALVKIGDVLESTFVTKL